MVGEAAKAKAAEVAKNADLAAPPDDIRHDLSLSRARVAELLDVSATTVERWEHVRTNAQIRAQLPQIQAVRDLGLCVYTLDGFREFLRAPLPNFDGRTPLQLIEQGKTDDVIAALAADYEGLGF